MFNNYQDSRKILLIIVCILGIWFLIQSFQNGELFDILLILPGLILALTVHEFSHAKMADKLGDPTPENQGRLTLNPLAHMDPVGTICLLFAGFGWGKPVQINSSYFRNPAKDNMLVALAGPVSNFILAFIFLVIYGFAYYGLPLEMSWARILLTMILFTAQINLSLGVFNLLPFPPLDGSKILSYFLKGKAQAFLWNLERYSVIILIILYMTELPRLIITPIIDWIGTGMLWIASRIWNLFI